MERDGVFYECKVRARTSLLRLIANGRPIEAEVHEEAIALIRLHTGAPGHVVECAYNEALAEMAAGGDGHAIETG